MKQQEPREIPSPSRPAWPRRILLAIQARPQFVLAPLLFVLVIGGCEGAVRLFHVPKLIIPAPSSVGISLYEGFANNIFGRHILVTLYESLTGFVIGATLGFILGLLVSSFPLLESTLYPYIVAFQTLPKVAVAPIVIVWFGFGLSSKIVLTATMSFFPMLANTIAGLQATEPEQMELLAAFTASRWQIFRMLKIPMALPYVFVGLDLAILMSVTGAIVGEFVGASAGLGYLIQRWNMNLDVAGSFSVLVVLGVIGILFHVTMQLTQRRVVFWMEPEEERIVVA